MSAVEIIHRDGSMSITVKGGQLQDIAELAISVIGTQCCPMMVGTVIKIFVLVFG